MSMPSITAPTVMPLSASQIEDLRLASSTLSGADRRSFQAAMTLKYCRGNARQAERVLGWNPSRRGVSTPGFTANQLQFFLQRPASTNRLTKAVRRVCGAMKRCNAVSNCARLAHNS